MVKSGHRLWTGGTGSYAAESRVHMHVKRRHWLVLFHSLLSGHKSSPSSHVGSPLTCLSEAPHSANRIIRLPVWSCTDVRGLPAAAHLCPASCGLKAQDLHSPGHRGGTRAGGNSRSERTQAHQAAALRNTGMQLRSLAPASSAVAHSAPIAVLQSIAAGGSRLC